MIVDTSALVAVAWGEEGATSIGEALTSNDALIPAPVVAEFALVTSIAGNEPNPHAQQLLARLIAGGLRVEPFDAEDAALCVETHRVHGRGGGKGGKLNMLGVMVYCMAKRRGRPILCAGRDFAATGIPTHPASRTS